MTTYLCAITTVCDQHLPVIHFEYCYRDASNFKAHGYISLLGKLSLGEQEAIVGCLEDMSFFIAEQVGIPALYQKLYEFSAGPTESDHCWHEFSGFTDGFTEVRDEAFWGTTEQLLERFEAIPEWDIRLSPHYGRAHKVLSRPKCNNFN